MARQTADKDQPRRAFEHYPVHRQSLAVLPPAIHTPSPVLQSPWRAPCPAASPSCFPIQSAVCCGWPVHRKNGPSNQGPSIRPLSSTFILSYPLCVSLSVALSFFLCCLCVRVCVLSLYPSAADSAEGTRSKTMNLLHSIVSIYIEDLKYWSTGTTYSMGVPTPLYFVLIRYTRFVPPHR